MHRVYVENVLEETMNYYDDKEEGALTFEQIVPGKYYRYNRDYGICEIMESASNKPKILRYLTREGGLLGGNGDLFEVDKDRQVFGCNGTHGPRPYRFCR